VARPVYSTLFTAANIPPGVITNIVTPLSGDVAVIRQVQAWTSPGNIGAEFQLFMVPGDFIWLDFNNLSAGENNPHWEGRVVVEAPMGCSGLSSSFTWSVVISGYLLTPS
jgi:hypothetical protein